MIQRRRARAVFKYMSFKYELERRNACTKMIVFNWLLNYFQSSFFSKALIYCVFIIDIFEAI